MQLVWQRGYTKWKAKALLSYLITSFSSLFLSFFFYTSCKLGRSPFNISLSEGVNTGFFANAQNYADDGLKTSNCQRINKLFPFFSILNRFQILINLVLDIDSKKYNNSEFCNNYHQKWY